MIEPFYLRWWNVTRALFSRSREAARQPWMDTRPDAHDGGGGEPGSTPLGTDDETGQPPETDGRVAPLDGRRGPPGG